MLDSVECPVIPQKIITLTWDSKVFVGCIYTNLLRNGYARSWPSSSYVAPISWLVESDVGQARSRMNLSRDESTIETQQELLGRLGAAIKSRQMPPAKYTLIHPSTKA